MLSYDKKHHIPRDEAVEKFIDNSKLFAPHAGYGQEKDDFYLEIAELSAEGWDFDGSDTYNNAIRNVKYLKSRGYKVKTISKGTRTLIFKKYK